MPSQGPGGARAAATLAAPRDLTPLCRGDGDTPSYNIFAEIGILPKYSALYESLHVSADILNVYSAVKLSL